MSSFCTPICMRCRSKQSRSITYSSALSSNTSPIPSQRLVKQLLRPGGSVTVFEGDHGSAYFHPHSEIAHRAIACQVELQRRAGGNACIGRQLYPLLVQEGYEAPCVT